MFGFFLNKYIYVYILIHKETEFWPAYINLPTPTHAQDTTQDQFLSEV